MAIKDRIKRATDNSPEAQAERAEQAIIDEVTPIIHFLRESRKRREYEWFINDIYYKNVQYLKYNVGARRVQTIPVEKMMDRVVINKVKQQVRGIVSFLNSEHPSVGVRPGDQSDDAYLRAKKEKDLCDYWYRHLDINKKAKKISLDGAKYGMGWAKIMWDKDAMAPTEPFKNGQGSTQNWLPGEVSIDRCDPFEIYYDPTAQTVADMRYIAHVPVRTLAELKANPLYKNTDKLTSDPRLSASILKQSELRLLVSNAAATQLTQPDGMDTTPVWEIFRKVYNSDAKEWQVWITVCTESGVLLRNEQWFMNEYPFTCFLTDVAGMLSESNGVIHDIREPNRALNEMVSQVHETARIMGHLNWLMPRGSNVNVITDETGQFIEYDITPGGKPEQAQAITLPSYIEQHINNLIGFIEDISGMHAAFNGKAPFAQASGDLVEQLSLGDQNSLTIMRDNYDDFFVDTYKLMLKTAKKNYQVTRKFPTGKNDEFGEVSWQSIQGKDISVNDDLEVTTGTQMPYSIAQKQQMYMNLWKEKAITDPSLLFKLLEMPDIDAAMGDDENDIERQLNEIRDAIAGKTMADPEIFENHSVHIETLDKFGRGDRWLGLKDNIKQAIRDHRQKHITFSIQLAQISASMQMEPIKRSITIMNRQNSMSDTTPIERTSMMAKFGIQSDTSEVQLRGGLFLQDPQQAELQAQNEDIEMMDYRAVKVSFGDNHIVHLQTHAPVLDLLTKTHAQQQKFGVPKGAEAVSETQVNLFKTHIKDHTQAMMATQPSPGLVPDENIDTPNQPTLKDVGKPNQMPQEDTNVGEKPTMTRDKPPIESKPPDKGAIEKLQPVAKPPAKGQNKSVTVSKLKPRGGTNGKRKRK